MVLANALSGGRGHGAPRVTQAPPTSFHERSRTGDG